MCTESMRIEQRETVARISGTSEARALTYAEWVCGECGYFEDVEIEDSE
jgi:hypothetical protein